MRYKTCSFDCIYCQLGRTTCRTIERKEYVPHEKVLEEVQGFVADGGQADYVTLSGSGEPTLNCCAGAVLRGIEKMTDIPTAVLTNSSLIHLKRVRDELDAADLVIPSLDAATEPEFQAINRPDPSLKLERLVDGLVQFSRSYAGRVWLEVMIVAGYNDDEAQIHPISDAVSRIDPEKVQLNTVVRPPSEDFAKPVSEGRLREISHRLGAEVIPEFEGYAKARSEDIESRLISLLSRRPCTVSDICVSLGLHVQEALKHLRELENAGVVVMQGPGGGHYYSYRAPDRGTEI